MPTDNDAIECLKKLITIYHTVNSDGEPTASIIEIVDTWLQAKEIVSKYESKED